MAGSWQNISLYLAKAKPWVPEATRCSLDIPKQYFFLESNPLKLRVPQHFGEEEEGCPWVMVPEMILP